MQGNSSWGEFHLWNWRGFRCHWRVLGTSNKRPMLLLHGFGASSAHWRKNAVFFANCGYRVFALDLIGFGKSDQPSIQKSLKGLDNEIWGMQVCAFLREIVQTDVNGKAVLIGNSLGGLVALTANVREPESVAAVVAAPLPDPALMGNQIEIRSQLLRFLKEKIIRIFFFLLPIELILPLITRTFLIKKALQAAYVCKVGHDKELLSIVTDSAQRSSAAGSLRAMCVGMSLRSNSSTAPELIRDLEKMSGRTPFLLIWGRQDRFVPFNVGNYIRKKHPWINFSVMETTGHCPHDEASDSFNEIVSRWLDLNFKKQEKTL
ncbi:alpha/beta fold hydrolase [Prochlorococcus sp. MIT 1341]|uniref:alpha/beta fold hydrolase n=1 Tax=Prochlorococcus sp. MIT 1341 TaxID=3096221 RepID=UPI002A755BE7|nr:alpha/beta fold hydrolase [Prochlorococcus sp. MIT 1341]